MKRLLHRTLTCSLIGLILLQLGYLSRGLWLEPWLRARLADGLARELGGDVRVGAIDGNWVTGLVVRDVRIDSPTLSVDRAEIRIGMRPWTLLRGDLAGWNRAEIVADRVAIDPARPSRTTARPPRTPGPLPVDALPNGARLSIGALVLRHPTEKRGRVVTAPASIHLEPAKAARPDHRVMVGHCDDLRLRAVLEARGVRAEVRSRELATWLTWWSGDDRWAGGRLTATIDARAAATGWQASGHVHATGMAHDGRVFDRSQVSWRADSRTVRIDRAHVALPGLLADIDGLRAPLDALSTHHTEGLRGHVAVHLRGDQNGIRTLLPERLWANDGIGWTELHGSLRFVVDGDQLLLDRSQLRRPGLQVDLERGSLPWVGGGPPGQVVFALRATQPLGIAIGDGQKLSTRGTIRGVVRGTLSQPNVDAEAHLTEVESPWVMAETISGRVQIDGADQRVVCTQLTARGLRRCTQTASELLPADAEGHVTVGWSRPELAIEPNRDGGLRATGELQLTEAGPTPWTFRSSLRLDHEQVHLEAAQLSSTTLAGPVPIATGSLRWSLPGSPLASQRNAQQNAQQDSREHSLQGRVTTTSGVPFEQLLAFLDRQAPELARSLRTGLPPELHRARIALDLGLTGSLAHPRWSIHATSQWTDLGPLVDRLRSELWPAAITSPARPSPLPGSIELRARLGRSLDVDDLVADLGRPNSPAHVRLSARGHFDPSPGTWSLANCSELETRLRGEWLPADDLAGGLAIDAELRASSDETRIELHHATVGRATATGHAHASTSIHGIVRSHRDGARPAESNASLRGSFALEAFDPGPFIASLQALADPDAAPVAFRGQLSGSGELGGTLATPRAIASLTLRDGEWKAGNWPRLENLRGSLRSTDRGIELERLTGTSGAGRFELLGHWRAADPEQSPWEDLATSRIRLQLSGTDVLLTRHRGLKLRVHPQLVAEGTPAKVTVRGEVSVAAGKFVRHVSLLPDLGNSDNAAIEDRAPWLVRLPDPLGPRLWFDDVNLRTERSFEVRTDVIACDLDTTAQLRGPGDGAWLVGVVNGTNGTLDLPGATLDVETMMLRFDGDRPGRPAIQLTGSGRRHGIELRLGARGEWLDPEITLTSDPPLPREDLIVLATTGTLPSRLRELGSRGQSVLLGSYLAQELRAVYFGSESTERGRSVFDRLSFSSGREISDRGVESLELEFELGKRLYLQAERDVYEDYNMGLGYRLRF